uniref:Uncharacterized protein n=1 Tax=Sphaerodactylus townsendi TaxID=933632 RepID=A0ACB8FJC1_9SAUR
MDDGEGLISMTFSSSDLWVLVTSQSQLDKGGLVTMGTLLTSEDGKLRGTQTSNKRRWEEEESTNGPWASKLTWVKMGQAEEQASGSIRKKRGGLLWMGEDQEGPRDAGRLPVNV